jgi:TorA maturation chaperone TorD
MQHADKSEIQIDRIDGVDSARMEEYALLAALLRQAPDSVLLKGLSGIRINSTPLGAAHAALARAAAEADPERLKREFFELFIGVGRGELLPYGSYYLTGFLNERPLARLRDDLRMLGIVRAEQQHEPEDHAAILCEIMLVWLAEAFLRRRTRKKDSSRNILLHGSDAFLLISRG